MLVDLVVIASESDCSVYKEITINTLPIEPKLAYEIRQAKKEIREAEKENRAEGEILTCDL